MGVYFEQIPLNSQNLKGFVRTKISLALNWVQICEYFKPKKAKMTIRFLPLLLLPLIGIAQTNSQLEMPISGSTVSEKQPLEIKRNALYNLEEIKVRWKKAALENCTGVPCVVTVTPPTPSFTCGTSTISDIDENVYNTVLIGTQCWTNANLKVTKYNDGTAIPDETANIAWGGLPTGARTWYSNGISLSIYVNLFGYLYNWHAVADSRKLCPTGWHVPTDGEWTSLIQYIDPSATTSVTPESNTAGGIMKSPVTNFTTGIGFGWDPASPGTNSYGFAGRPGGFRDISVGFSDIRRETLFWSATENSPTGAWYRSLNYLNSEVNRLAYPKATGASVRCLKD